MKNTVIVVHHDGLCIETGDTYNKFASNIWIKKIEV